MIDTSLFSKPTRDAGSFADANIMVQTAAWYLGMTS